MRDYRAEVTVLVSLDETVYQGLEGEKLFRSRMEAYLKKAFEDYFVPWDEDFPETPVFFDESDCGNQLVFAAYEQNDDGKGAADVESFAAFAIKEKPLPKGVKLIDVLCEAEELY